MNSVQASPTNWLAIQRNQRISHRNNAASFLGSVIVSPCDSASRLGSAALSSLKKLHTLFSQSHAPCKVVSAPSRLASLDSVLLEKVMGYSGENLRLLSKQFTREKFILQCSSIKEAIDANRNRSTVLDIHFGDQLFTALPTLQELQEVVKRIKQLKEIRISGRNVNDRLIADIINCFPGLNRLSIADSDLLSDAAVRMIAVKLKKLSALKVSSCPFISNASFHFLRDKKSPIKRLEITKCPQITKEGFKELSGYLKRVAIPAHHRARGYSRLIRVATGLKNLTYLRTSHFLGIGDTFHRLRSCNSSLQTEEASTRLMMASHFVKENKLYLLGIAAMVVWVVAVCFERSYQQKIVDNCVAEIGLPGPKNMLCQQIEDEIQTMARRTVESCINWYRSPLTPIAKADGISIPEIALQSLCATYATGTR